MVTIFQKIYFIVDETMMRKNEKYYDVIEIYFRGEDIRQFENPSKEKFDALSILYKDIAYNKKMIPFSNYAVVDTFLIDITCDKDFNNYRAQTSLKEITEFIGTSPYNFIKSGYKDEYDWKTLNADMKKYKISGSRHYGYHSVNKKLSEITVSDMQLLNPIAYLTFTEKPLP